MAGLCNSTVPRGHQQVLERSLSLPPSLPPVDWNTNPGALIGLWGPFLSHESGASFSTGEHAFSPSLSRDGSSANFIMCSNGMLYNIKKKGCNLAVDKTHINRKWRQCLWDW